MDRIIKFGLSFILSVVSLWIAQAQAQTLISISNPPTSVNATAVGDSQFWPSAGTVNGVPISLQATVTSIGAGDSLSLFTSGDNPVVRSNTSTFSATVVWEVFNAATGAPIVADPNFLITDIDGNNGTPIESASASCEGLTSFTVNAPTNIAISESNGAILGEGTQSQNGNQQEGFLQYSWNNVTEWTVNYFTTTRGRWFVHDADGDIPFDADPTLVSIVDLASIKTLQSTGPTPPGAGESITWTVELSNITDANANQATLVDTLPSNVTFVSASATTGTTAFDTGANTLTWSNVDVLANSDETLTINAIVNSGTEGETVTNVTEIELSTLGGASRCSSRDVTESTFVVNDPQASLTIEKTAGTPTVALGGVDNLTDAGDTITYTYVVENTGNTTLSNVVPVDSGPRFNNNNPQNGTNTLSAFSPASATLAPGESQTFTAVYILSQDDVDNVARGNVSATGVTNTATATGEPPTGVELDPVTPSTAITGFEIDPNVELVKGIANPGAFNANGDLIEYTFTITNTGNITLTQVRPSEVGPTINGSGRSGFFPQPFNPNTGVTLAPGESQEFTRSYQLSQNDVNNVVRAGDPLTAIDNQFRAFGQGINSNNFPQNVFSNTVETGFEAVPELTIVKSINGGPDGVTSTVGPTNNLDGVFDTIQYQWTVTNTGTVTTSNITVSDAGPTFNGQPGTNNLSFINPSNVFLNPGQSQTFSAQYQLSQTDVNNILAAPNPDESIVNVSSVVGSPFGAPISSFDSNSITTGFTVDAELTLVKSVASPTTGAGAISNLTDAGDTITYSFFVTNSGGAALDNITVNDPGPTFNGQPVQGSLGPVSCQNTTLNPNSSTTCTATYTLAQGDIDNAIIGGPNSVDNTATAQGQIGGGAPVTSDPSSAETTILGVSEIELIKTAGAASTNLGADPSLTDPGDTIDYTIVAENTGSTTLSSVVVSDSLVSVSCPATTSAGNSFANDGTASLEPGESITCAAQYVLDQADIDAGEVVNTALVESQDPSGAPINADDEERTGLTQRTSVALTKTASPEIVPDADTDLIYSFLLDNTGNVSLTSPSVTDPLCTSPATVLDIDNGFVGGDTNGNSILDSEEVWEFTCTRDITQAEFDAAAGGDLTNTATGTGTPPAGLAPPQSSAGALVRAQENVGIALDKLAGIPTTDSATGTLAGVTDVGDTVTYTFEVTNISNVTLNDVTVADPLIDGAGGAVSCPTNMLAPDESVTCTAVYELTQDDLDTGLVNNTATATATPLTSVPIDPPSAVSSAMVPLPAEPSLEIEKSVDPLPTPFEAGQVITYRYVVTNTGNVTINDVEPIDAGPTFNSAAAVNSLSAFATTAADTTLAPGEDIEFTSTYVLDQADIDNMAASATPTTAIDNSATADGTPENGTLGPVEPSEVETGITPAPSLNLVKSSVPPLAATPDVGDVIAYTFALTNDGNVTITNPVVNDALCQPSTSLVAPDSGDDDGDGALDIGETFVYSCTYALQQSDLDAGLVENTATATGQDPAGQDVEDVSGSDATNDDPTITPLAQVATWDVVKSTIDVPDSAGDTLDYTFTVSNTGNVSIGSIVVSDPKCASAPVLVAGDIDANNLLSPLETFTFSCTSVPVTQAEVDAGEVVNTVNVSGSAPPSAPALPVIEDTVETPIAAAPELSIDKSAAAPTIGLGAVSTATDALDTIVYSFEVENSGNVSLSSVSITDPGPSINGAAGTGVWSGLSCPSTTLLPLQTVTCTATYTLSQADVDAAIAGGVNAVENIAVAEGQTPTGLAVESLPDTELVTIESDSSVSILKDAAAPSINVGDPTMTDAGDTINYTITVENTGNTTLSNVLVADTLTTVSCPATALPSGNVFTNAGDATSSLAVGDSVVCTATYIINQADINNGQVTNTATVASTDPAGTPVDGLAEEISPFTQRASVALIKTASVLPAVPPPVAGDIITYTFELENTGNVSLSAPQVDDPQCQIPGPVLTASSGLDTATDVGADGILDAVEIWTFMCDYAITEADIIAGEIVNTATGSGTPPPSSGLDNPTGTSSALVNAEQNAAISLNKIAGIPTTAIGDLPSASDVGDTITYTFEVANIGNLPFETVTIDDPLITGAPNSATISCELDAVPPTPFILGVTGLGTDESITCEAEYVLTQADIDAGMVTNMATAIGDPPGPVPPSPAALSGAMVPIVPEPELEIEKSVSAIPATVVAGEVITYSYEIENTGNVTIENVAPVDLGPTFNGVLGTNNLSVYNPLFADLAPGDTQIFSATYILSQQDLDNMAAAGTGSDTAIDNEATADGEPMQGLLPPVDPSAVETGVLADPSLALVKTSSVTAPVFAGSVVTYSFTLNNDGNVTVTNPVLNDPLCQSPVGPLSFTQGFVSGDTGPIPQALDVGETWVFECDYMVTQANIDAGTVQNTAVASGQDPAGGTVQDTSGSAADNDDPTDTALPRAPAWTINKSTNSIPSFVGDTLVYDFIVTNTGNTSITPTSVNDARCVGGVATLDPSSDAGADGVITPAGLNGSPAPEQWVYSCVSIPVTQAEIEAGEVINNVTAVGTAPGAPLADATDQLITPVTQEPAMSLVKSAGAVTLNNDGTFDQVFNFELKNTGNIILTNVAIIDDIPAQFGPCLSGITAPGVLSINDIGEPGGTTGAALGSAPTIATASSVGVEDSVLVSNYVARFNPNASGCVFPNPAQNTASGSSDQANDVSDNGTDPDAANSNDAGLPTPFAVPVAQPQIGVSKAAGEPILNADGTFDVPYTLLIENTGNVDLSDITLADDLEAQFDAAVFTGSAATVTTGGVIVAPAVTVITDASGTALVAPTPDALFAGTAANDDLLSTASSTLGVGDSIQVTFTIRLNPAAVDQTIENTATAGASDPSGAPVTDDSNDGSDPTANPGGPGSPTPVTLPGSNPSLIISKEVASIPEDLGNGSFRVTFNMVVENDGNVDISDLQVEDDLLAALNNPTPNGATVANASVAFVSGTTLTPNPSFTGAGNNNMLLGTDSFPVGSSSVLALTFEFIPDSYLGPYLNMARVMGMDPAGNIETDDSEDGATPSSTNGVTDVNSTTLFTVLVPTVPISLGSFATTQQGDVVVFNWVTQTEIANIGFYIYALVDDEWKRLNEQIIPSQGDSVRIQSYEFAASVDAQAFSLGDLDVQGVETLHGPFMLGESSGVVGERQSIDWEAERAEREAKAAARKARLEERQRLRIEQEMQKVQSR